MSDDLVIKAEPRTTVRRGLKALRRAGLMPGAVYGAGKAVAVVQMPARETTYILRSVTGATLINLDVTGTIYKVLVREVQRHPTRDDVLHIDFQEVDMAKTINVIVQLNFVGAASLGAVGNVLTAINDIEVEALPGDLIESIDVDLSALQEIGDQIFVSDLTVPAGIIILTDINKIVAQAVALAAEEEELVAEIDELEGEIELIDTEEEAVEEEEE